MPALSLIAPVLCIFERLDVSIPIQDDQAREPLFGPDRNVTNFQAYAQISFGANNASTPSAVGEEVDAAGYIVIMETDAVSLQNGDRIIQIGGRTNLDLYLTKDEPIGHWGDIGGNGQRIWYFEDRSPSKGA